MSRNDKMKSGYERGLKGEFVLLCLHCTSSVYFTNKYRVWLLNYCDAFFIIIICAETAIQLNLILSILISLALFLRMFADIDLSIVKRLAVGSLIGAPIGVALLTLIATDVLKIVVGLLLIGVTVVLIKQLTLRQSPKRDGVVGGISGVLTASIGMPGPPLIVYFSGARMSKEVTRATTLAFFLLIYPVSLTLQAVFVGVEVEVWRLSLFALPFVALGLVVGQMLFKRISQRLFRRITFALLLLAGIGLIVEVVL
ncbi:sulfite exporter TauE/SafE family protein [Bacillus sp. JCM 19041]|uniref:sulfite exporter TauE/SafE family protein n=1 Tax=Bacillus sp. JCM 19041 TaxID=1460637 RepID=UPI003369D7C1